MSSRKVRVVILCEGIEDYDFARAALRAMGWARRDFTAAWSPRGKGAGEQFVREQYVSEARAQRSRKGRVLLVMTDADKLAVAAREAQLAAALKSARQPRRAKAEAIAHWIPRRNLETWVHLYTRGPVDERTDYKRTVGPKDHVGAAELCGKDLARLSIVPRVCHSLDQAVGESRRIRR